MAELFINRNDLVSNSIVDGNVDQDKFLYAIKIAQEIHIRNYTGTDLYNKLSDEIANGTLSGDYLGLMETFIKPMLIHYSMVEYLPFAAYQIKNNGVFRHTSEYAESLSKEEIDFLVNKERDRAEYYTRRFIEHMNYNMTKFPEYNSNSNDDISPDNESNFHGWVL